MKCFPDLHTHRSGGVVGLGATQVKTVEVGGGRWGWEHLMSPQLNYEQTEQQYSAKMVGGGWLLSAHLYHHLAMF